MIYCVKTKVISDVRLQHVKRLEIFSQIYDSMNVTMSMYPFFIHETCSCLLKTSFDVKNRFEQYNCNPMHLRKARNVLVSFNML